MLSNLQRRVVLALSEIGYETVSQIARHLGVAPTDLSSSLRRMRDTMIITTDE